MHPFSIRKILSPQYTKGHLEPSEQVEERSASPGVRSEHKHPDKHQYLREGRSGKSSEIALFSCDNEVMNSFKFRLSMLSSNKVVHRVQDI